MSAIITTRAVTDVSSVPVYPYSIFYMYYDMYIDIVHNSIQLICVSLGMPSWCSAVYL